MVLHDDVINECWLSCSTPFAFLEVPNFRNKASNFKAFLMASNSKMLDGQIAFLAEFGSTVKPNCNE